MPLVRVQDGARRNEEAKLSIATFLVKFVPPFVVRRPVVSHAEGNPARACTESSELNDLVRRTLKGRALIWDSPSVGGKKFHLDIDESVANFRSSIALSET
jgi:hypothetical protein